MSLRTSFQKAQQQSKKPLPTLLMCLIALIAGGIFSFSLAPFYYWWLALLSPALLYVCLSQRNAPQAFMIGWSFGFGLWFVGAFWLYHSIHYYGDTSAWLSVVLIGIMSIIMGLFNALQTWAYRRFFPETPLTFAPLWVAFEWLKTWLFTGFPWLFVGYAFTERYLDNFAPLIGIFGVSFVALTIATGCIEIFKKRFVWGIPIALLFIAAWGSSFIQFVQPSHRKPLSVSLVQGNIPQDIKWLTTSQQKTLEIYQHLSASEWGRNLVVWPESAIPMLQTDIEPFILQTTQNADQHGSAWISGIPYYNSQTHEIYNSVIAQGHHTQGQYNKQRLVPFGEYIPLASIASWILPALQEQAGLTAGISGQKPLNIQGQNLGTSICYEVAYPNITRLNAQQSGFMLTVSNDAWFTGTAGPWQHLQMVQMRAKENGRWFIRATNTGVTAFIDQDGHIVKQAPLDQPYVLRGDLPSFEGQTLYNRLGDYPILILSTLLLLLGWRYRPKKVDISFKSRR